MSSSSLCSLVAALALLTTLITTQLLGYGGGYFYIYGMHTCPYCTSLKEFLASQYGNDSVYFCDLLNEESTCAERFINFTSSVGLPESVPLTFVIKDLDVKAIVIGAVTNRGFWDSILNTPKSNEIPIYVGGRAYYALLVNDTLRFIEAFTPEYLITRNTSTTNTTTTFPMELIIAAVVAATATVAVLIFFLKRR